MARPQQTPQSEATPMIHLMVQNAELRRQLESERIYSGYLRLWIALTQPKIFRKFLHKK